MDASDVKSTYLMSSIAIVLIIMLISQAVSKSNKKYHESQKIAVKTSQGIIKMYNDEILEELNRIYAELTRHVGYERTEKYSLETSIALDSLRTFISRNPHNADMVKLELKAKIINDMKKSESSMSDLDDIYIMYEYMLQNLDVVIKLIQAGICDNGLLDLLVLQSLLDSLDDELYTVTFASDLPYDKDRALAHLPDPYVSPSLALFESRQSQIEGLSVEDTPRKYVSLPTSNNSRDYQKSSQLFRTLDTTLGTKLNSVRHYIDDKLL